MFLDDVTFSDSWLYCTLCELKLFVESNQILLSDKDRKVSLHTVGL